MLPHDLDESGFQLPEGDRRSIVLFSGNSLRHLRLGYLIQSKYPGYLKAWWCYGNSDSSAEDSRFPEWVDKGIAAVRRGEFKGILQKVGSKLRRELRAARYSSLQSQSSVEKQMFGVELRHLKLRASLNPTPILTPNTDAVLSEIRRLDPYFLLALGGPLIGKKVLDAVRGLAINQHAGWSPDYKGGVTTEMALYHRDLLKVGSTVHIINTAADAGPILRRSTVTLHPDDSIQHCFCAVVALGTAMLLEVLEDALTRERLPIFVQPKTGHTFRGVDLDPTRMAALVRDFSSRWLADALQITKDF